MTADRPVEPLVVEGREITAQVEEHDIPACLLGGVAICVLLGERMPTAFERPYRDLDILTRRSDSKALAELLTGRGWLPAREFNLLNGARRLLFHDSDSDAHIDVFVDTFEMCHPLPLADGLTLSDPTLPATELLMTKLQIVRLNPKDRTDLYALLARCPLGPGDRSAIDPASIVKLTSRDWGLHHTFELNLNRLLAPAHLEAVPDNERAPVLAGVEALLQAMGDADKSRGWKMRARIGERKRWYEEPEDVEPHAVADI